MPLCLYTEGLAATAIGAPEAACRAVARLLILLSTGSSRLDFADRICDQSVCRIAWRKLMASCANSRPAFLRNVGKSAASLEGVRLRERAAAAESQQMGRR